MLLYVVVNYSRMAYLWSALGYDKNAELASTLGCVTPGTPPYTCECLYPYVTCTCTCMYMQWRRCPYMYARYASIAVGVYC